jgi:hypothetical protein
MKVGDAVYWEDPDEGLCSGDFTITEIIGDMAKLRGIDSDSEVEAPLHELEPLQTFYVVEQQPCIVRWRYVVNARNSGDALERYANGNHSNAIGEPEIGDNIEYAADAYYKVNVEESV